MVVSISSKNNDHLQRNSNNCLNSILCVPFAKRDATAGRKLSDGEIHKLAKTEGKVVPLICEGISGLTVFLGKTRKCARVSDVVIHFKYIHLKSINRLIYSFKLL